MMLPSKDEEEDDDPRVNLVEQLIVYNRFKMTQADLFALLDNNLLSYDKSLNEDVFNTNVVYTISYNKDNLFNTFNSLINDKKQALASNEILIVKERYKTEDLVQDIKNILLKDPKYSKILAEHRALLDDYITRSKDDYRSLKVDADPRCRNHTPGYPSHEGPGAREILKRK